jgi:hypothetical protein
MLTIRGRFDPNTEVELVRSFAEPSMPARHQQMRPREAVTVIETAVADETGTVTFAFTVPTDESFFRSRWPFWVRGRSGHQPLAFLAITSAPDETGNAQIPIQPDRRWTPRAPKRTPTTGGAS